MKQSNTSSGTTRDRLRQLMSQHTATSNAGPAPAAPAFVAAPELPRFRQPAPMIARPAPVASAVPKTIDQGERCTVRLPGTEVTKVDEVILATHQRVGERITISDVLRIGLARITATSPITAEEIAQLRASDGRRSKLHA